MSRYRRFSSMRFTSSSSAVSAVNVVVNPSVIDVGRAATDADADTGSEDDATGASTGASTLTVDSTRKGIGVNA
jgi:hypothetical protein